MANRRSEAVPRLRPNAARFKQVLSLPRATGRVPYGRPSGRSRVACAASPILNLVRAEVCVLGSAEKAKAVVALHRFGMGPRPGSITAIEADPQGALLAELD